MTALPPPRRSIHRHRCNLPEPTRHRATVQCSRCHRRYRAWRAPDLTQQHEPLVWVRWWWPWPRPTRSRPKLPTSTTRNVEIIERHWYGLDA